MERSALQSFLDRIDGTALVHHQQNGDPVRCDSCSGVIHPNRTMSMWWTNRDASGTKQQISLYRLQCDDCTPPEQTWKSLGFSPKGWLEIVTTGRLTTEKTVTDVDLLYYSTPSEGGNWTPEELMGAVFPLGHTAPQMANDLDGPMDAIGLLIWSTIDPREIISEAGVIEQSPDTKHGNVEKMAKEFERKGDLNRALKFWERYADGKKGSRTLPSGMDTEDLTGE